MLSFENTPFRREQVREHRDFDSKTIPLRRRVPRGHGRQPLPKRVMPGQLADAVKRGERHYCIFLFLLVPFVLTGHVQYAEEIADPRSQTSYNYPQSRTCLSLLSRVGFSPFSFGSSLFVELWRTQHTVLSALGSKNRTWGQLNPGASAYK